jgi:TBC1 domain family member 14
MREESEAAELGRSWVSHLSKSVSNILPSFLLLSAFTFLDCRLDSLSSSTLRELCYRGIPPFIRVRVWPHLAGNSLQITPELYQIFKTRASTVSMKALPHHGREESMGTIQYDLPRTHAQESRFHDDSPQSAALKSILQTYASYRPDIGYVQGMGYVAAMCVEYLDEYQAFTTFANLLSRQFHFNFLLLEPEILRAFALTFDEILQRCLPRLHRHLRQESVSSEIFLLDWGLTLFSKALPLPLAARLWDVLLLDGEVFFVKACLGICFPSLSGV